RNISFNYRNDISALLADLHIGELITHPQNLNLQSLLIQLKDVQLKNTTTKIVLGKTQQAQQVKDTVAIKTKEQLSNPWKVQISNKIFIQRSTGIAAKFVASNKQLFYTG